MVGIIGCGKVGLSFGMYLKNNNIKIGGIYDVDMKKVSIHKDNLQTKVYSSVEELLISNNLVMVAVPDDNIIDVWNSIKNYDLKGKTIFHTSGSHSTDVFLDNRDCDLASLHPMMTFLGDERDKIRMKEVTFAYEGDAPLLLQLLSSLGNNYFEISKEDKVRYHLAGVYSSNLLIPVVNRGIESLRSCGLEQEKVREILLPLVEKTIENIFTVGSREAITGPIERGDLRTIEKHLRCEERGKRKLYIEGSRELLKILDRKDKKIEKLLEEYS